MNELLDYCATGLIGLDRTNGNGGESWTGGINRNDGKNGCNKTNGIDEANGKNENEKTIVKPLKKKGGDYGRTNF